MMYKRGGFRWRERDFIIGTEVLKIHLVLVIKFSWHKSKRLRWSFLLIDASGHIKIHQEATLATTPSPWKRAFCPKLYGRQGCTTGLVAYINVLFHFLCKIPIPCVKVYFLTVTSAKVKTEAIFLKEASGWVIEITSATFSLLFCRCHVVIFCTCDTSVTSVAASLESFSVCPHVVA